LRPNCEAFLLNENAIFNCTLAEGEKKLLAN
jgi:hypothetical protein